MWGALGRGKEGSLLLEYIVCKKNIFLFSCRFELIRNTCDEIIKRKMGIVNAEKSVLRL